MGLKVNYKGSQLTSMDETGTKTLLTNGKYCEDNFEVVYEGSGSSGYTATVDMEARKTGRETYPYCSVQYNNVDKSSNFNYEANDTLTFNVRGGDYTYSYLYINNALVASAYDVFGSQTYNYTLPSNNIQIKGYYIYDGTDYDYYTYVTVGLEISEYGSYIADSSVPYDLVTITSSEPSDAVRFFDYDGTILYSYSKTQFLALSSMPANPSHTGLTAQGWNWSLSDAKAHVQNWDFLDIGQMYITSDGTTQIDIELHKGCLTPYLGIGINGTVSVDWGDGSSASTVTGTSLSTQVRTQHVYAQEGNYTIKISVTSGSFAFFGTSAYPLLNANNSTLSYNLKYSSCVKEIRFGNGITNIGSYGIKNCHNLTSVTMPSSITSIGQAAFSTCRNLSFLTISNGYSGSIASSTFYYCSNLQYISLPKSIPSVASSAFNYCYNLNSFIVSDSTLPDFSDSYLLRKVVPNYGIKYNILGNNTVLVTDVSGSGFAGCRSIKNVIISSQISNIPAYAFYQCKYLTTAFIPANVNSILNDAFNGCNALSSLTLSSGINSIMGYAFANCFSLSSITIPTSVTSLGTYCFSYCEALSNIQIPSSITEIPSSAFYNCTSLISVSLPSTLTTIGSNAFANCSSLSSITIPSSVTSIGNSAFSGNGMSECHIQATIPPTLGGTGVFLSGCTIYVPSASLSAYQSDTNWATYSSQLVGE